MRLTSKLHDDYGKFVVAEDINPRGRIVKQYLHFDSIEEFLSMDNKTNHYYEVIDGVQRLYMDIDIPNNTRDFTEDVINVKDVIKSDYPNAIINIYSSHREKKQSFHIIVKNIYVYDNVQCKYRIQQIVDKCPDEIKQFIDMSIYSRYQLFRLMHSSKFDQHNTKILIEGSESFYDSLIGFHDGTPILPDLDIPYKIFDMRYYARKHIRNT